jgi:Ca2+-binding EF-hand superfamily protein
MSSIGGISNSSAMMQGTGGMRGMHRPDPTKMAENLFSQLDTSGQGYIQKADLQSAFDKVSSSGTSSSSSSTNVDDLFTSLDTNSDGKVTKQEFADSLKKLQDSLDQQFQDGRMQMAMQAGGTGGMNGMGGMPPPPPPQGGNDKGFTKDELSSQLNELGSSDSKQSSLISSIIQNFDKADTDSDGKVSFREAMAYQQSTNTSGSSQDASSATSQSTTTSSASSGNNSEAKVMMQIMKLMHAYMTGNSSASSSTLSVSA